MNHVLYMWLVPWWAWLILSVEGVTIVFVLVLIWRLNKRERNAYVQMKERARPRTARKPSSDG